MNDLTIVIDGTIVIPTWFAWVAVILLGISAALSLWRTALELRLNRLNRKNGSEAIK